MARIAPLTSPPHKAATSRSSKRKANARAEPLEDESSDAFEDAVSKGRDQDHEMEDAAVTPQDTEDDTDDDEPGKHVPAPVKSSIRRRIGGRAPVADKEKTKPPEPSATRSTHATSKALKKAPEEDIPPPRRELPFARKKAADLEPEPAKDDDETDDDEL